MSIPETEVSEPASKSVEIERCRTCKDPEIDEDWTHTFGNGRKAYFCSFTCFIIWLDQGNTVLVTRKKSKKSKNGRRKKKTRKQQEFGYVQRLGD